MYLAAKLLIKIDILLIWVKNKAVCAHNSLKSFVCIKNCRTFAPSKDIKDNKFKFKVGAS